MATFYGLAYGNWEKAITSAGHSALHHVLPKSWLQLIAQGGVSSSNSSSKSSDSLDKKDVQYPVQLTNGKQHSIGV